MKFSSLALMAVCSTSIPALASATTLLDYPQQGIAVSDGRIDIDSASVDGIGITDGQSNIGFGVTSSQGFDAALTAGSQTNGATSSLPDGASTSTITRLNFAQTVESGSFTGPVRFSAGDIVDDTYEFGARPFTIYDDGELSLTQGLAPDLGLEGGETTFLGFNVSIIENTFMPLPDGTILVDGFATVEQDGMLFFCSGANPIQQACGFSELLSSNFGFLEITRGSLIPGRLGVNLTSGVGALVPATISPVPLPAAGWLLLAGLGVFGRMARPSKAKN